MKIYFFLIICILFCKGTEYKSSCDPSSKTFKALVFLDLFKTNSINVCSIDTRKNSSIQNTEDSTKELLEFYLTSPSSTASIQNFIINMIFPFGTTNLSSLKPVFKFNGTQVLVNGIPQISGESIVNFTNPVIYTVFAKNGSSVNYTLHSKVLSTAGLSYTGRLATGTDRRINIEDFSGATQNFTPTSSLLFAVALDQQRNILYVSPGAGAENFVRVYDSASSNTNTVSRQFIIPPMNRVVGIVIDSLTDTMYLINRDTSATPSALRYIFRVKNASTKSGTLTSGIDFEQINSVALQTSTQGVRRMYWDAKRDILYVCEFGNNLVLIYDNISKATHLSTIEPQRTIVGIIQPTGVTHDKTNDILFVSSLNNLIYVYEKASSSNGLISPDRVISSPSLNQPFGIFFVSEFNRLYVSNFQANNILFFNNATKITGSQNPIVSPSTITAPADITIDISR